MKPKIPALVITGPVGAGKSTTLSAISLVLERSGIQHAVVDMDYLRWILPSPPGDAFAARIGYQNLAAIWPNLRSIPLEWVLLGDVVESRSQIAEYTSAMPGTEVTVVRLDVPMPLIMERLRGRETDDTIEWFSNRAPELQEIMEREKVADVVIDVGHRSPEDIAAEIVSRMRMVTGGMSVG